MFTDRFQGSTSFVKHLCYLCLVFAMLSRLFIAALWSSGRKGLTSWLLFVMFILVLLLSHLVSWDKCGTCFSFCLRCLIVTLSLFHWYRWSSAVRFLILVVFLTFIWVKEINLKKTDSSISCILS